MIHLENSPLIKKTEGTQTDFQSQLRDCFKGQKVVLYMKKSDKNGGERVKKFQQCFVHPVIRSHIFPHDIHLQVTA